MSVVISGSNNGSVTTGAVVLTSQALGAAVAGEFDYNGTTLLFTPIGTQRGVVPGMQYFRLNGALAGTNVTTAQNVFGVGCTLSASTVYAFEAVYAFSKSGGTTSHSFQLLFGGTATINNISYVMQRSGSTVSLSDLATTINFAMFQTTAASAIANNVTAAGTYFIVILRGTVSVNAGGTFIPQYALSAAPGGAYTTAIGSYFSIYPVGAAGSNVSVGTWA